LGGGVLAVTRRPRADEHVEFYGTELGREVLDAEVQLLVDRLPSEGRVLSIGCGVGVHEVALRERRPGLDLVCSDLQDEMLVEVPVSMERVGADMLSLPFADGTFDAVYEITALVFVHDPERALNEMARVLRPRGLLLLLSLNPLSRWGRDRLRALPAPWGSLEGLVAMVEVATGGTVSVDHALNLEDEDVLRESTGLDDASLILLESRKATDKS
jgi:SAM-dependent methyltransferase